MEDWVAWILISVSSVISMWLGWAARPIVEGFMPLLKYKLEEAKLEEESEAKYNGGKNSDLRESKP